MRLFTVQQAEELLPYITEELDKLQPAFSALRAGWERIANEHGLDVGDPLLRDACLEDDAIREAMKSVDASLEQIRQFGVECKSIEDGIFDFPCLLENRLAYLCWKVGEEEVSHWHEMDAGFSGRQLLFDESAPGDKELLN